MSTKLQIKLDVLKFCVPV